MERTEDELGDARGGGRGATGGIQGFTRSKKMRMVRSQRKQKFGRREGQLEC